MEIILSATGRTLQCYDFFLRGMIKQKNAI